MSLPPPFLLKFVRRLKDRGISVSPEQLLDLRGVLQAGLGWHEQEWRVVCTSIFARNTEEFNAVQVILTELMPYSHLQYLQIPIPGEVGETVNEVTTFQGGNEPLPSIDSPTSLSFVASLPNNNQRTEKTKPRPQALALDPLKQTGEIPVPQIRCEDQFFFSPRFPVHARVARQMERYLRVPVRSATRFREDIDATVETICYTGIASAVVSVRAEERLSRLVLVEDRSQSMMPFHAFIDVVSRQLSPILRAYFNNIPTIPFYSDHTLSKNIPDNLLSTTFTKNVL